MSAQEQVVVEDQACEFALQLKKQQQAYLANPMPSADERIARLKRLRKSLLAHQDELIESLNKDFGRRSPEETLLLDVLPNINNIDYCVKRLKKWMKTETRHTDLLVRPAKVELMYQPVGVVGIIGAWNGPIIVTFGPLVTALAAGNSAMIKMSEFNPETNKVAKKIIAEAFDDSLVSIFDGEAEASARFSALPFNHLMFTGSTAVGRHVMRAASANLVPVTLELGGKCPVIVCLDMDIDDAVSRFIYGKCANSGQICLSPDYILCPEGKEQAVVDAYCKRFKEMFPAFSSTTDHSSVHSERHFQRLQEILSDAKAKGATVISANGQEPDPKTRMMPTHLVLNATEDMIVMQEEIFGPILPIKGYKSVEEAVSYINQGGRPLGLYIMSFDKTTQDYILNHTHSGGVSINEVVSHALCDDVPFGGVGDSGIGHYHGHEGFKAMSKAKTVLKRGKFYPGKFTAPPYDKGFLRPILKWLLRQ